MIVVVKRFSSIAIGMLCFSRSFRLLNRVHVSQLRRLSTVSNSYNPFDLNEPKELSTAPIDDASLLFNEFSNLGLLQDIVKSLAAQGFENPTPVQRNLIPRILAGENIAMAASTGSGKTLAYTAPVIQSIMIQEREEDYRRLTRRPRCLILVPTRELARQVLSTIKNLAHVCKISSTAVLGGESYSLQKRALERVQDIVVALPGRLLQHKEKGNVFFSQVNCVIIDEVDTMLTQGFGSDIRAILRTVMGSRHNKEMSSLLTEDSEVDEGEEEFISKQPSPSVRPKVQLVMATATMTKAVRSLLTDVEAGGFNIEYSDPSNLTPRKLTGDETRVRMKIVEVDGVHRALANVRHEVEFTRGANKFGVLDSILQRHSPKKYRTMIFCNTIDSARAMEYHLKENGIEALSYHGDLNSHMRKDNLQAFRDGSSQFLVCTDIAARGIDIPEIDHVIIFDFPLNPIDYLHRSGRCGRAGRKGLVTSVVAKRDEILSNAIQGAIARGLPLDSLTSSKKDYQDLGKLAQVVGRRSRDEGAASPRLGGGVRTAVKEKLIFGKSRRVGAAGSGVGNTRRLGSEEARSARFGRFSPSRDTAGAKSGGPSRDGGSSRDGRSGSSSGGVRSAGRNQRGERRDVGAGVGGNSRGGSGAAHSTFIDRSGGRNDDDRSDGSTFSARGGRPSSARSSSSFSPSSSRDGGARGGGGGFRGSSSGGGRGIDDAPRAANRRGGGVGGRAAEPFRKRASRGRNSAPTSSSRGSSGGRSGDGMRGGRRGGAGGGGKGSAFGKRQRDNKRRRG